MNDIERAQEKRRERQAQRKQTRTPEITANLWWNKDGFDGMHMHVEDLGATPIQTNSDRATLLFEALWHGSREDNVGDETRDQIVFLAYLDQDGRAWTRISGDLLEGKASWVHARWLARQSWSVVRPMLRVTFALALKPYRKAWPLRRWKWLQAQYFD